MADDDDLNLLNGVDTPPLDDLIPEGTEGREWILKQFKDVGGLAKSYAHLRRERDTTVRVPRDDAPAETWTSFHRKMGAPESIDGYELPDADEPTKELFGELRKEALAKGIPTSTWKSITERAANLATERMGTLSEELKTQTRTWENEARDTYGAKFEPLLASAKRYFGKLVDENDSIRKVLDVTGLGSHPAFLDLFVKVANVVGDDKLVSGPGGTPDIGAMSLEGAKKLKQRAETIIMDPAFKDRKPTAKKLALSREFEDITRQLIEAGYEDGVVDRRLAETYFIEPPEK
ncbi:MAG: hypothetical protein ACE5HA_08760 [Anaerolineae bacterium]